MFAGSELRPRPVHTSDFSTEPTIAIASSHSFHTENQSSAGSATEATLSVDGCNRTIDKLALASHGAVGSAPNGPTQTANTSEDSDSNNLSAPAVEGTYNLVIDRSKKKRIEGYGKAEAEIMKETKAGWITKREARTRLEALKEKLWGDDDKDGYYKAEARDWLDYLRNASAEEGKKAINTEKFRHLPVEAQRVIIEASGFKLNAVGVVKIDKTNKKEAEIMKTKAMVKADRITKKQADAKLEFLNKAKLKS